MLLQELLHSGIGENVFDPGLGVIEIPADGADRHIAAGLGGHLQFLHGTHAVLRIKNDDPRPVDIGKTVERGLAGIAGRGHEYDHGAAGRSLSRGGGQQIRQQLQRHILERAGGTVPEFQQIHAGRDLPQRCGIVVFESAAVSAVHAAGNFLRREIGQEERKHRPGAAAVVHRRHAVDQVLGQNGK